MDSTATVAQLTSQDIATLRGLIEEWVRICLAANWDSLAALLTDDVVFQPPDQPIVEGKKAVRTWLDTFPPIKAFEASLKHAEGRADLASTLGTFKMTVEPNPGSRITMTGKWAATYRRQSDGQWLCSSDTWNTDHPVSAA